MGRTKSTIVFKVSCVTDLPKFAGAQPVYRRYSQFRWLHQLLAEKYPGVPRPSLPMKVKVGGLEKRGASLGAYMTRLVQEPSFLLSTELLIFLTADDARLLDAMQIPGLPFLKYGWEAMNRNNPEKASIWFGQALQAYIVRKDITGQFQSLRFLGEVCQLQQRWTPAAKTYRQLLKVAQQMDDHEGAAIALINMARCCHQLKDFNTSVSCLTEMFERAGELGQLHLQAVALRNIGMVHASLFDYEKAIKNFRDELKLREQLEDPDEIMKASEAVGLMLFRMFDVQGAITMFESYLEKAEECIAEGLREGLSYKGLALLGLGTFYDYLGENETAIEKLNESLSMFESLNDDQNATVVMNNIGIYYRRVCQFSNAEKYFRNAYSISKDNRDLEMQTRCLRNLALVANRNDDFGRSMTLIAECVQLAEKVDDQRLLAQAYRTQADIFMLLSDMENANTRYTICEGICKGTEDKVELARCLCGLGELAAGKQDPDNARALEKFEESLDISQSIGYKKGIALANYGTGLIYRRLGNFARAAESLYESAENFKKTGNGVMHCRALAQFALCKCYDGIYDQAFTALAEAKQLADPVRDKQGVALVTDTEEVVEKLKQLLGESAQLTIKAQRELTLGEYKTVTVGVLVTVTQNELRIVGDGKKASSKLGAEQVDVTVKIDPSMKIDLGRGAKSKFLIVRTTGREDLLVACQQRSLLYTVLNVLTTKQRTCGGQTTASGSCLTSMRVGVSAEFTIQAKLASGEACSAGGDHFQATLRRKAPLPGEPVYSPVDESEDKQIMSDAGVEQRRDNRLALGRGEAYDISEGPTIVIDEDGLGTAGGEVGVSASGTKSAARGSRTNQEEQVAELEIIDNQDGSYTCAVMPRFSGQCTLDVVLNGLPIQGSPFMPEILPADICPAKCDIPDGAVAARGKLTRRLLCLRDEFGNQLLDGGAAVRVTYKGTELALTDQKDGTYSFNYDAEAKSGGQLVAMVNGVTVDSCPLSVTLEDEIVVALHAPASSSKAAGQLDLIATLEHTTVALTSVAAAPELFAAAEFETTSSATAASAPAPASASASSALTIVEVEEHASALLGDLNAVTRLAHDSRNLQLPAIASTIAALQALPDSGSEQSPSLDPQLKAQLDLASQPYQQAKTNVEEAVSSGNWGEVAHRVETRAARRSEYMAALRRVIAVAPVSDKAAKAAAASPLTTLLEGVPATYGAQAPSAASDAGDPAAAFSAWQVEADSITAAALHEFSELCNQMQENARDSTGLWVSLTSAGQQNVDALIDSLQPMAVALRDAGSTLSEGIPPVVEDGDEDDEDEEESVPPGALPPAATSAIVAALPKAMEMCNVFQQWSTAASEAAAAQQKHLGLCDDWASQARALGEALKQCSESGREAGPTLVYEARQRLETIVSSTTEDLPQMQLRKLVAAETLEKAVPDLEMQFLGLTNQPAATQQQEAPALVSKLQALLDAGFVEITATLESAKSLLV
jgi:tetratricopeptide (TPR) repeat protein